VVLGFIAVVMLLERLRPAVHRPFVTRGHVQDLVYLGVYAIVVVPFILVLDLGFSLTLQHAAPWLRAPHLAEVPRLAILVLGVLLMDAFNWMAHWSDHRWDALWRFHAVHHSQEEVSVLTTFRAHPLVHLSFVLTAVPGFVLAANAATPATLLIAYACLGTLPHANVPWTYGRLGRLVISPAYHRAHHRSAGRLDVNLGVVFPFWDALTGRAIFPIEDAPVIETGLGGRPIPVEQAAGRPRLTRVFAIQWLEPFRRMSPVGASNAE
jgi:sterol desaturase/sphingolipid hydroxylase (fatty acid hydroxylase superfamily)